MQIACQTHTVYYHLATTESGGSQACPALPRCPCLRVMQSSRQTRTVQYHLTATQSGGSQACTALSRCPCLHLMQTRCHTHTAQHHLTAIGYPIDPGAASAPSCLHTCIQCTSTTWPNASCRSSMPCTHARTCTLQNFVAAHQTPWTESALSRGPCLQPMENIRHAFPTDPPSAVWTRTQAHRQDLSLLNNLLGPRLLCLAAHACIQCK